MELTLLQRGTSPFKEATVFSLTVAVSTLPGSVPAWRDLLAGRPMMADDAAYLVIATVAVLLGIVSAFLWHFARQQQKTLVDKILARDVAKVAVRAELEYPRDAERS